MHPFSDDPKADIVAAPEGLTTASKRLDAEYSQLIRDAAAADKRDHDLTLWQAIKSHKKAVFWSMALSATLIMEGYDIILINAFYGQAAFLERFGVTQADGSRVITPAWQNGLSNGALVGEIIGLAVVGQVTDKFGFRKTMMVGLACLTAFIFLLFFAKDLPMFVAGLVLCGIPWGAFQTMSTAYACEVCPMALRAILCQWICMCWGIGMFLSSGVVRACLSLEGDLAWRVPVALQWVWPVPLFLLAYFAPESPQWFVRNGRYDDALVSLKRLADKKHYSEADALRSVAMMRHTNELEMAEVAGTSYFDCFKGTNLRRTEIAAGAWAIQNWCGNPIDGFAVLFLQQAGITGDMVFNLSLITNATYIIGAIISWYLVQYLGRRPIYVWGNFGISAFFIVIGALGFVPGKSASYAAGSLLIIQTLYYSCTIGPVCYTIVAEMPSGRLRSKTIVIARLAYNISGLIWNTLIPRMVQSWGWGAKTGLFGAGTAFLCFVYCWFRLPETRGKSFGEIDLLFEHKVPARKFAKTQVDQFGEASGESLSHASSSGTSSPIPGSKETKIGGGGEVQHIE